MEKRSRAPLSGGVHTSSLLPARERPEGDGGELLSHDKTEYIGRVMRCKMYFVVREECA
jgi:hypothetical protein